MMANGPGVGMTRGARTGFDEQCVVFRLVAFAAAAGNHHV
jgi:hypothetical protein